MFGRRCVGGILGLALLTCTACTHDVNVPRPCGDACLADAAVDRPADAPLQDTSLPDLPLDRPAPDRAQPDKEVPADVQVPDTGPLKPTTGICIKGGWCWMHPLPQGHSLRGVWAASASEVYAVGDSGTLLRWNAGKSEALDCGTMADLNAVWGSSATNVWAVGDGGAVVWTDGKKCTQSISMLQDLKGLWGHSATAVYAVGGKGAVYLAKGIMGFVPHTTCGSEDLNAVWGSGATELYAVGDKGTVMHLQGKTCKAAAIPKTTDDFNAVWGSGSNDIYAVGTQGAVLHYTGSWAVVSQFSNVELQAVWGTGPTDVHVAGQGGTLHHFATKWQNVSSPTKLSIHALHGAGGKLHAVGALGTMMIGMGTLWSKTSIQSTGASVALNSIRGNSPADIMAIGSYGAALSFDGKNWGVTSAGGDGNELKGVWAAGGSTYWAVGYTYSSYLPVTLYFDGTSWANVLAPSQAYMLADVWGAGGQVFATGGHPGSHTLTILEKSGSAAWKLIKPGAKANGSGIWGRSATDLYVVGKYNNGAVLHRGKTSTWTKITPPTGVCDYYHDVWGTGPSTLFLVGHRKGIPGCVHRRQGQYWKGWTLSGSVVVSATQAIWGTGPSNVYVVGSLGKIHRFDGTSWKQETIGTRLHLWDIWGTSSTNLFVVGHNGAILHKGK